MSGSGTWLVTDVPDSSAWYGYHGTVTLTVTNLGTGKVCPYKGRWR